MIKQKKQQFQKGEQPIVYLDGISLKVANADGKKVAFVEITGDQLNECLDFGDKIKIKTGKDENGYPYKYSVRFTAEANINPAALAKYTQGFYKLATNNLWIDTRDASKLILRVAQVEKFECYFAFENNSK